jgi:hypothetical protein
MNKVKLTDQQVQRMAQLLAQARYALADSATLVEFMAPETTFEPESQAEKFQIAAFKLIKSNCAVFDQIQKFHAELFPEAETKSGAM